MGFTPDGLPVGLEILGRPWSEPTLIKLASGFEAATDNRRVPEDDAAARRRNPEVLRARSRATRRRARALRG